MTDPVKEQLSACLDGELPERELDLLLKQVGRDVTKRAALGRYALIGEALRAQSMVVAPRGFAERVSAAVAAEPPLAPSRRIAVQRAERWLRPAAGIAVAAGVAGLAIFALKEPLPEADSTYVAESVPAPTRSIANEPPQPPSYIVPSRTSDYVPATRLTNYVVAHSEYSSPLGRRSVLSGVLAEEEVSGHMLEEPGDVGASPQSLQYDWQR